MCHVAKDNGVAAPSDALLAAAANQMQAAAAGAVEGAVRMLEPVDYLFTAIHCSDGDGCDPDEVAAMAVPFVAGTLGVAARDIRWTQDTISPATREGPAMYLDDLIGDMADYGYRGDPLQVVEIDGEIFSFNNRRLAAAKVVGIDVPIEFVDMTQERWIKKLNNQLTTKNGGTWIRVKGTDIIIDGAGNIRFGE